MLPSTRCRSAHCFGGLTLISQNKRTGRDERGSFQNLRIWAAWLLAGGAVLSGAYGVLHSFRIGNEVARFRPDGSFRETVTAVALSAGLGPDVADDVASLATDPPRGTTFRLAVAGSVPAGESEALRQVLRSALYPAVMMPPEFPSGFAVEARLIGGALRVSSRAAGKTGTGDQPAGTRTIR